MSKKSKKVSKEDVFDYLETLRESGQINMFGAPAYLREEFGFNKQESYEWFSKWTKTYNK